MSFCNYGTVMRPGLATLGVGTELIFLLKLCPIKKVQQGKYVLLKIRTGQQLTVTI